MISLLTAGWEIFSLSAAAVTPPASMTARNISIWRTFMVEF
jgi:hypothetical protein